MSLDLEERLTHMYYRIFDWNECLNVIRLIVTIL